MTMSRKYLTTVWNSLPILSKAGLTIELGSDIDEKVIAHLDAAVDTYSENVIHLFPIKGSRKRPMAFDYNAGRSDITRAKLMELEHSSSTPIALVHDFQRNINLTYLLHQNRLPSKPWNISALKSSSARIRYMKEDGIYVPVNF